MARGKVTLFLYIFLSVDFSVGARMKPKYLCPTGKNIPRYPKYCPREDDAAEFEVCCVDADNQPSCCRKTSAGQEVTLCPQEYKMDHCPSSSDPKGHLSCCRFIKDTAATDKCCPPSWVMADVVDMREDTHWVQWRLATIILGVLFSATSVALVVVTVLWCR